MKEKHSKNEKNKYFSVCFCIVYIAGFTCLHKKKILSSIRFEQYRPKYTSLHPGYFLFKF